MTRKKLRTFALLLVGIGLPLSAAWGEDLSLGQHHLDAFQARIDALRSGVLKIKATSFAAQGEAAPLVLMDGELSFDVDQNALRLNQLGRTNGSAYWLVSGNSQYALQDRTPQSAVVLYPREKYVDLPGLCMPFDFRRAPLLSAPELTLNPFRKNPELELNELLRGMKLAAVETKAGQVIATLESGFEGPRKAAEFLPEPLRSQLLKLIDDGVPAEKLPLMRCRTKLSFDEAKVGELASYEYSLAKFGSDAWRLQRRNEVLWSEIDGTPVVRKVTIKPADENEKTHQLELNWTQVNGDPISFDVHQETLLLGRTLRDATGPIGVVGIPKKRE